jgi:two-component system chemotaxis response regulator CheY
MNLLIVDDNVRLRQGLKRSLEHAGHCIVGEASDGRTAVLLFSVLRPDAVIMDYEMPRLNGIEALREIKQQFPEAVVIICSGENVALRACEAGAKAFLLKPFSARELLELLGK